MRELTQKIQSSGLWGAVIAIAHNDLHSDSDKLVFQSALYFFTEGEKGNIKTFDGICLAHDVDATVAAKKIWNGLPSSQRKKISKFLKIVIKNRIR